MTCALVKHTRRSHRRNCETCFPVLPFYLCNNNTRHASRSHDSRAPGRVFCCLIFRPVQYAKPAIPIPQQLALLQSRGLIITDIGEAERALARLSYYRLSAYFLSFQTPGDSTHAFRPGTTFTETLRLYEFDEELRPAGLSSNGYGRNCPAAQLAYHNSLLLGPHWYEIRLRPSARTAHRRT
jgi:hypothetical protein